MTTPECPICWPPTFTYDPPTEELMPDACPARGNHEIIKRAFEYLWRMEARLMAVTSGPIELAAAAQARADIERLRTAHLGPPEHGFDEESILNPVTGKPYGPGPLWAGAEPMDYPDPLCLCGAHWWESEGGCQADVAQSGTDDLR